MKSSIARLIVKGILVMTTCVSLGYGAGKGDAGGTLGIYLENDLFAGIDKHYRTYAGWLYLGVGVVWKNSDVRNSLVLDIGVAGPASQAEETQGLIHDLRDFESSR